MTIIGFDYTSRIDPAALKAAGCQVAFRYLSQPGWPKNLTLAEARELLAAGIAIVLNYETTADFMLAGFPGGVTCARSARSQATALTAPTWTRIYYSADFDVTAAQVPTVMAFLGGAASVDGAAEVDDYGGLRIAQAAAAAGMRPWQTVAWSGGVWDPRDVARQTGEQRIVGGVQVDVNEIEDLAALGAWGGPTSGDNDMTPDEHAMLQNINNVVTYMKGASDWQWYYPAGREQVDGTHAHRLQAAMDNTTALRADTAAIKTALAAIPAPAAAVDPKALAAALAPLLTAGATADEVAAAVLHHLSADTANG